MRIITGRLGGRQFDSPRTQRTHPMSDKVRGALFNALGDITGLSVLDAFAGSGALSFEAVSRGASQTITIDIDKSAISTIVKSVNTLGVSGQVKAVRAAAASWLATNPDTQFDLVLLDPPYDDIKPDLLAALAGRTKPGGTVVLSLPPQTDLRLPSTIYHLLSTKSYGDAVLVFYRQVG